MRDAEIVGAFDRHGVRVDLQPVVALDTSALVGVEALARMRMLSAVGPDRFVPALLRAGLGPELFSQVCVAAVSAASEVLRTGGFLAVNADGSVLSAADFAAKLLDQLTALGVDPRALVLEISETSLLDFSLPMERQLAQLRREGVRLAVDDAGVGYSSLTRVIDLRPEFIKIDRSLILGLPNQPWRAAVAALHQLSLGVGAVAIGEGVETAAQLEGLREIGVEAVQGYLIGVPSEDGSVTLAPTLVSAGVSRRPVQVGIIDDDPVVLDVVSLALELDGHQVVARARDPDEFFLSLRRRSMDLAVVDLALGGLESSLVSVIRPLRILRPEISIVVYTSSTDAGLRQAVEDLGCGWIDKANGPAALNECIVAWSRSRRNFSRARAYL